mmetsp:Transcript_6177/g.20262  ORF Transcript_6177/g.20262 Transcript_6177/m.20262 type:complete len:204 (+) Transcript_6177:2652-3263(+)
MPMQSFTARMNSTWPSAHASCMASATSDKCGRLLFLSATHLSVRMPFARIFAHIFTALCVAAATSVRPSRGASSRLSRDIALTNADQSSALSAASASGPNLMRRLCASMRLMIGILPSESSLTTKESDISSYSPVLRPSSSISSSSLSSSSRTNVLFFKSILRRSNTSRRCFSFASTRLLARFDAGWYTTSSSSSKVFLRFAR